MNLKTIAARTGVSVSTVSRVMNGSGYVKSSTRNRILKAIEGARYQPNALARSLVAGATRTIGMVVSNLENPFFVDIFHALEDDAHAHDYELLVANTNYETARLVKAARLMLGRRVAGLAVVVSEMEPALIPELEQAGIPVAIYDVGAPGKNLYSVRFDYSAGMRRLAGHLHALGHRRLAYIGYPLPLRPTDDRRNAFLAETSRLGIETRCVVAGQGGSFAGGRDAVRDIMRSGWRPTGILCVNDVAAIGVLRELRNEGIDVPREMSVTGFDNIGAAEFTCPSLTTIDVPRERIGHILFDTLFPADPQTRRAEYLIDPELVVRESTGPAPRVRRKR